MAYFAVKIPCVPHPVLSVYSKYSAVYSSSSLLLVSTHLPRCAEAQRKRSPLRLWGEGQGEVPSSFFGGTSSRESSPLHPFIPWRFSFLLPWRDELPRVRSTALKLEPRAPKLPGEGKGSSFPLHPRLFRIFRGLTSDSVIQYPCHPRKPRLKNPHPLARISYF